MKKGLISAAALIGAALLGLPWFLGEQAQRLYGDALVDLPEHGLGLIESHYDRGWFDSHASTDVELMQPPAGPLQSEKIRVRVASRISHGPWSLAAPRLLPAAAIVESRVEMPVPGLTLPPLLLTTVVELDGGATTKLSLPATDLSADNGRLALQTSEGQGEAHVGRDFATGEGWFKLDALTLTAPEDVRISLRDLRSEGAGSRWLGAFFLGTGQLTLAEAAARLPDLDLLATAVSVQVQSERDGDLLRASVEYSLDGLRVNEVDYGPSLVRISIDRIAGEDLLSVQQAIQAISANPVTRSMAGLALGAVLTSHLPRLLEPGPRIAIDRVDIATPDGKVEGHVALSAQGMTPEELERPGAWIKHLQGAGEFRLPEPVLLAILESWHRRRALEGLRRREPQTGELPAERESEIAEAAREQLASLVNQGWVEEQEGRMTAVVKLADALLSVNGKTIPLTVAGKP